TGPMPFKGNTSAMLFDAILHQEPDPSRLPPELQPIILKALEKDRDVRCQTASELRADLKRLKRQVETGKPAIGPALPPRRRRAWAYAALAAIALAAATASLLWLGSGGKPASRSEWVQLTQFPDSVVQPALSPD